MMLSSPEASTLVLGCWFPRFALLLGTGGSLDALTGSKGLAYEPELILTPWLARIEA